MAIILKKIRVILLTLLATTPLASYSDTLCSPETGSINKKIIGSYKCQNHQTKYTTQKFSNKEYYGIVAQTNQTRLPIEKKKQSYNPIAIDMDWAIGFLPLEYQVFLKNDRVIYIFTEKSTLNGFSGQCGSGSETHLGIINLSQPAPKKEWSTIIASCSQAIVPKGSDITQLIDAISHFKNSIQIHWDFFKQEEDKIGTIEIKDGKITFTVTNAPL